MMHSGIGFKETSPGSLTLESTAFVNAIKVRSSAFRRFCHLKAGLRTCFLFINLNDGRTFWWVEDCRPVSLLRGHENDVFGLAFSESGDRLISGSSDKTIRIWDTETGVTLQVLQGHLFTITGLAVKGDTLFSASNDGTVRKWNLVVDERMRVKDVPDKAISSAISSDGQEMAVGLFGGGLYLYSLNNF